MSDYFSQTEHPRIAVEGRRIGTESGPCTVVAIRKRGGYELYPHGVEVFALWLPAGEAGRLGRFMTGGAA